MISSLSNLADRNFVLGFLLPVIIATFAAAGVFPAVWPLSQIWSAFGDSNSFEKLTIAVLALWTVAVLLMTLNHALYQFLEGYWGPFAFFSAFKNRQIDAFDEDEKKRAELRRKADKGDEEADGLYWDAEKAFRQKFSVDKNDILPTRFGNTLRAFETYSFDVYGLDAIPGWLRLSAVIPEGFQKLLDNARAEVDFYLNNVLLFSLLAAVSLIALIANAAASPPEVLNMRYFAAALAAPTIAFWCYRAATARAPAWGDLVRSAFDMYLPDMVKQMGYDLPIDENERIALIDALNGAFLLNRPIPPAFRKKKKPEK